MGNLRVSQKNVCMFSSDERGNITEAVIIYIISQFKVNDKSNLLS